MIKVNIYNKQNQIGWSATFNSEVEKDNWIAQEINNNSWGKPDRWVKAEDEDVSQALETRIIGSEINQYTEYRLPAEYSIVQEDITSIIEMQNKVSEGKKRQELGAEIIAKVYAINESKGLTAQAFSAMISDANLERIERLLWTGSLKTAKMMIQALDDTYFSIDEKSEILEMLSSY